MDLINPPAIPLNLCCRFDELSIPDYSIVD